MEFISHLPSELTVHLTANLDRVVRNLVLGLKARSHHSSRAMTSASLETGANHVRANNPKSKCARNLRLEAGWAI